MLKSVNIIFVYMYLQQLSSSLLTSLIWIIPDQFEAEMSILIGLKIQDQACQAGQRINVQGSKVRGDIILQQADGVFADAIEIALQGMSR